MPQSQRVQQQNQKIQEIISNTSDEAAQISTIAPIRQWFRPETNSLYYPTVQSFMNDTIDIDEASKQLFTPIDGKISSANLDDVNFLDLWYSILLSARQIPPRQEHEHTKLTYLLDAFKTHSVPGNDKYNYLYSSLTDFEMAAREAYNDAPEPHSAFDVEIRSWASLNYFLALVTRYSIADFSIFAIWALRQGLETPFSDDDQGTVAQKYKTFLPAAAAWIFGMGRELFTKEQDLTPPEGDKRNPAKGGELWNGKAEFSKQRWQFWKARFAELCKNREMDGVVTSVCADAVEAMERSETFEKMHHGAL